MTFLSLAGQATKALGVLWRAMAFWGRQHVLVQAPTYAGLIALRAWPESWAGKPMLATAAEIALDAADIAITLLLLHVLCNLAKSTVRKPRMAGGPPHPGISKIAGTAVAAAAAGGVAVALATSEESTAPERPAAARTQPAETEDTDNDSGWEDLLDGLVD